MAQVSVGQIENLNEAINGLQSVYESMEAVCHAQLNAAEAKLKEVEEEAKKSAKLLQVAEQVERQNEEQLEQANEQLNSANRQLSMAQSALSACKANGSYGKNGNYKQPDCSFEESECMTAELAVAEVETRVKEAENALETAKENRIKMEQREEMSRQCLAMTSRLAEDVQMVCSRRLARASSHLDLGKSRLQNALAALAAYHDTHSSAASFYAWKTWSPSPNKPITPAELRSRLNPSIEEQGHFREYLLDRDPVFRAKIDRYRGQFEKANGSAERHAIQINACRELSGYYSEKIVEYALGPLGQKVELQSRATLEDGRYTKTDLVIKGLKVPVILGRGEGMGAPVGGSLAVEVKSGKASYLLSEKEHMVFQAAGHQKADASMTVCTRDIKDLGPEQENGLRDALRSAGSPLIGMLPKKDEIDKTCWEMVAGSDAKIRENNNAELAVTKADNAVKVAEKALDATKENRMRMEQQAQMWQQNSGMTSKLAEDVPMECSSRFARGSSHLDQGRKRPQSTLTDSAAYHDMHSSAENFYSWETLSPSPNKPITPEELRSRLNLSIEEHSHFLEYLLDHDPMFRAKVDRYRGQFENANGSAERHVIQINVRQELSGYYSGKIVEYALGPLGQNVELQSRTTLEDGRYTKTVLVIKGLKVPVILGRGEGMRAPVGGSLAVEVKSGKASYLLSEKEHMAFQAGRHRKADASMTVCTCDIKDLSPEQENDLRDALRSAGIPLIGMLPKKDEIDKICWEMIAGSNTKNGENDEN